MSSDGPLSARLKAAVLAIANRVANYRSFFSGPRVTIEKMKAGGVGVALSVLYQPFDEMDLGRPYGSPPAPAYFEDLLDQLESVETEVIEKHSKDAVFVHGSAELGAALEGGKLALLHCIEGGFHLGAGEEEIRENVAELRRRGVCYVTLAHLFWRQVATNEPAIPFLSDRLYDELFPQPQTGLAPLGRAALQAMLDERVLVDLSHMSERAMREVFSIIDERDGEPGASVIATHVACRLGAQRYNLSDETIHQIMKHGGVIGLIFADHQMIDGLRGSRTRTFDDSFDVLCAHIDHLHEVTGSHEYTAIGSDLDGFIKPTLAGLDDMTDMARLQSALAGRYGEADAARIASGNALRVFAGCLAA
jgi:membrane dipeptidase